MVEITAERSKVKAEEDASYSTCMFLHCLPYFFNPSSVKLGLPGFCHVCAVQRRTELKFCHSAFSTSVGLFGVRTLTLKE